MEKLLLIASYTCQIAMIIILLVAVVVTFLNRNKREYTEYSYFITTKEE